MRPQSQIQKPALHQQKTRQKKLILFVATLVLFCSQKLHSTEISDKLIHAIIRVESSGNDKAIGDKNLKQHAYGPMQIRQPCVDDVNRRFGTTYKAEQCLGNRELSVKIFRQYMAIYATKARLGHEPTDEDRSRIWNGGPNGWKNQNTLKYWGKVKQHLAPGDSRSVYLTQK